MSLKFVEHKPLEDSPRTKRIPDEAWNNIRPTLKHLYLDQGLTLSQVQTQLRKQHKIVATERQLKRQLMKWGLSKYVKHDRAAPQIEAALSCASSPSSTHIFGRSNPRSRSRPLDRDSKPSSLMLLQQLNNLHIGSPLTETSTLVTSTHEDEDSQMGDNNSGCQNRLACPLFIHNALAFSCCAICAFEDFHAVKQHIQEDFIFYSLSFTKVGRMDEPWTIVSAEKGVPQRQAIRAISAFMNGFPTQYDMAQKWETIYRQLFPFDPPPASPYVEDNLYRQAIQHQVNIFHTLGPEYTYQLVQQVIDQTVLSGQSCEESSIEVIKSAYQLFHRRNQVNANDQLRSPRQDPHSSLGDARTTIGGHTQPPSTQVASLYSGSPNPDSKFLFGTKSGGCTSGSTQWMWLEPTGSYGDNASFTPPFSSRGLQRDWSEDFNIDDLENFGPLESPLLGLLSSPEGSGLEKVTM